MQNGALRRVRELPVDTRRAMESITGRSLGEDDGVSINAYKLAGDDEDRDVAFQRLLARIDKTAKNVQDIREEDIDAAIDAATDRVRHQPE